MSEPGPAGSLAITVVGRDRPGIIAEVAAALAESAMNLEDSSMTLLRGHFAMTLICSGGTDAAGVRSSLAPVAADGSLTVDVRAVPAESALEPAGAAYLITVHGSDRLGIVARLAACVAAAGGNISDLTTRLSPTLYVLAAEVELPLTADVAALTVQLETAGRELGVDVSLRPVERDDL